MKLFTVGPVEMDKAIIHANNKGIPYFRNQEFSNKMFALQNKILTLLNAPKGYKSIILTCSGTGGMESAICSVPKNAKLLIVNGGTFGNRFTEICNTHNISYDEIKVETENNLTQANFEPYLKSKQKYFALVCNVNETSLGKLYDKELLRNFCNKKNCYLILDVISTAFADEFDLSKVKADITILSSQKALALAPGISILVLSKQYIENVINKQTNCDCYYLDIKNHLVNMERGQTPFTPALAEIEQLNVRLGKIVSYAKEVEKTKQIADYFRTNVVKISQFKLPKYNLSNCVTPVICVNNNATEIIEKLKLKGFVVNPCGGDNKDKMFRVGHIGNLSISDTKKLIKALEEA